VHYENPKIVVGSVATHDGRYLLCRRAIEPRYGLWTIPAGFLEEHETTEEGALREAREEACAELELEGLLGIYNIPRISQVQLIYKARLARAEYARGDESLEVRLFPWSEIPWDEIAFPSVLWALRHHRELGGRDHFPPFTYLGP
jgi:ADP-ribose pyrophosphatase YjhB (NUDIX family)